MKILNFIKKYFSDNEKVLYLGSTDILPPPLTKEEEESLVMLSNKGDMSARNKLIEHNLRLVVFLAKKYDNTMYDLEDLVSIGTIGLIKGVKTYKLDKNIKLATYASRCIDNEILMFLRKNNKIKTEVSIDEPINTDSEGNDLSLADILGTDNDSIFKHIEESDNKKVLEVAIRKLNDREKTIMQLRYGFNGYDELTQKEVADKLGISQSYISRIEKKVINNLKKDFLL